MVEIIIITMMMIMMIIIISNNNDGNNDDIIYMLDYSDQYGYSRLTEQNSPCSLSKSNGDAAKL